MRRDRANSYRTLIKKLTVKLQYAQLRRVGYMSKSVDAGTPKSVKKDPGKCLTFSLSLISSIRERYLPPTRNSAREKAGEKTLHQFKLGKISPIRRAIPRNFKEHHRNRFIRSKTSTRSLFRRHNSSNSIDFLETTIVK